MNYFSIIYCLLIFIVGGLRLSGQDVYQEIKALNQQDLVEETLAKINQYEGKFQSEKKWDSLFQLYLEVIPIYERRSGLTKISSTIEKAEKLNTEYRNSQDKLYYKLMIEKLKLLIKTGRLNEGDALATTLIDATTLANYDTLSTQAKIQKAWCCVNQYKPKEAIEIGNEILEVKEYIEHDTMQMLFVYQVMGISHTFLHETDKTHEYNLKQLELIKMKFGPDHPNYGVVCSQIGSSMREDGKLDEALKYSIRAMNVLEQHSIESGITTYASTEYYNLALVYENLGENSLAEQYLLLGLDLNKDANVDLNMYHSYNALTSIMLSTSDMVKATSYNDKAIEIITELEPEYSYFHLSALGNKVRIFSELGNHKKALKLGVELLSRIEKLEDGSPKEMIFMYDLMSEVAMNNQDTLQAIEYFEQYERRVQDYYTPGHGNRISLLEAKMNLQYLLRNDGQIDSIIREVKNLESPSGHNNLFANVAPRSEMLSFISSYSEILKEQVQGGLSIDVYERFVHDVENYLENHFVTVRTNSRLSKEGKLLKSLYEPLIADAAKNQSKDMLTLIERVKSLITRVLLQNQLIKNKNDDLQIIDALKANLQTSKDTFNIEVYGETVRQMESFQNYKDSLFKENREDYILRFGINNWDTTDINDLISKDELLIEYLQIGEVLYLIKMSRTDYEVLTLDFIDVKVKLENYLETKDQLEARALYDLLLPGELHKQYDEWLLLPDDQLHSLNFEELMDQRGEYLLMSKKIRYGYSATVLETQQILSESNNANSGILSLTPGFADELKEMYSNDQDSIWQYFLQQPFLVKLASELSTHHNSETLLEIDANEHNFNNKASDFKIVHFGTHGLLNNESPLFSKLVLAKDTIEDGYLHVYEIYGDELNSELAVLSACNSGQGKIESSDGIVSLTQAFTHAGCPSVLMTLWEVDEKSTAAILSNFYQNLEKGQKKSVALRNAKLTFLDNSSHHYQDPYYWAGLVVIGNDNAIFLSTGVSRFVWIGVAFILVGLMYFIYQKLNRI